MVDKKDIEQARAAIKIVMKVLNDEQSLRYLAAHPNSIRATQLHELLADARNGLDGEWEE